MGLEICINDFISVWWTHLITVYFMYNFNFGYNLSFCWNWGNVEFDVDSQITVVCESVRTVAKPMNWIKPKRTFLVQFNLVFLRFQFNSVLFIFEVWFLVNLVPFGSKTNWPIAHPRFKSQTEHQTAHEQFSSLTALYNRKYMIYFHPKQFIC